MKTQNITKYVKSAILLVLTTVSVFGCSKNSSDNTPISPIYNYSNGICFSNNGQQVATTYCSNSYNGYQYINGNCIQTSTNQVVNSSFCSNTNNGYSNNGYQYINGNCIQISTNQIVTPALCQQNSGNGVAQACYGWYSNGTQQGYCNGPGSGCGGLTLTELSTGRQVLCQ